MKSLALNLYVLQNISQKKEEKHTRLLGQIKFAGKTSKRSVATLKKPCSSLRNYYVKNNETKQKKN